MNKVLPSRFLPLRKRRDWTTLWMKNSFPVYPTVPSWFLPTLPQKKSRFSSIPNDSVPHSRPVPSVAFRSPWSHTSPKPLKVRSTYGLESLDSIRPVPSNGKSVASAPLITFQVVKELSKKNDLMGMDLTKWNR